MTSNISIFIKTKTKQKKNREIKVKKIRFFLYFKMKKIKETIEKKLFSIMKTNYYIFRS